MRLIHSIFVGLVMLLLACDGQGQQSTVGGGGGSITSLTNVSLWTPFSISSALTNSTAHFTNDASTSIELSLQFEPQTNRASIDFGDRNNGGGSIFWNAFHSGGHGEIQTSADSLAFGSGWSSGAGTWLPYRAIQLGIGNYHHPWVELHYDNDASSVNDPLGYSVPLGFDMYWNDGSQHYASPGIQSLATATTGQGGLRFYADLELNNNSGGLNGTIGGITSTNWDWSNWGYLGGTLQSGSNAVGWDFRGKMMQQRITTNASVASYPLDFSASAIVDINVAITPVALSTTGISPGLTNFERRVFYLRAGAVACSLTYPTTWQTNGSSPLLPASIAAANLLRLELEATAGPGETNVTVVSASVLKDQTFVWDQAALDFLGAASISVAAQSNAVNRLVVNAKAHGWWTLCDVIYPFVGGTAAAHSKNLKAPASFAITWTAVPTQDANGVTGNGTSQYGSTGFNFNVNGSQYTQNSAHIFVYCGTTTPTDGGALIGGYLWTGGTAARALIERTSNKVDPSGINNDNGLGSSFLDVSSDFRGPIISMRTNSTQMAVGTRGLFTGGASTVTTAKPATVCGLLARIDQSSTADHFSSANLRGASIGAGMSRAQWDLMRADWDEFEAALSRKVP